MPKFSSRSLAWLRHAPRYSTIRIDFDRVSQICRSYRRYVHSKPFTSGSGPSRHFVAQLNLVAIDVHSGLWQAVRPANLWVHGLVALSCPKVTLVTQKSAVASRPTAQMIPKAPRDFLGGNRALDGRGVNQIGNAYQ